MIAILNRFKRQKPAAAREKRVEPRPATPAAERTTRPKGERPFDRTQGRRIIGVIIAPHLTEKTSAAGAHGWYAFRVRPDANKLLVKQAVEDRYGVNVERVRILSKRPKRVRLGRIEGHAPGFKKAMVKVRKGQSIEFT
ncbi:MAG: 50S ribosomal protein L23 [Patescibacteria group bacterium]